MKVSAYNYMIFGIQYGFKTSYKDTMYLVIKKKNIYCLTNDNDTICQMAVSGCSANSVLSKS